MDEARKSESHASKSLTEVDDSLVKARLPYASSFLDPFTHFSFTIVVGDSFVFLLDVLGFVVSLELFDLNRNV